MDPAKFKTTIVSRGLTYAYYTTQPTSPSPSKPTLLFCHGFPSSTNDWRHIVSYFENQGHAVIVPDMLGYGGTDKPLDPKAYVGSALARDLVDILDAEGMAKVIAISHDWGARVISRLAGYFPERVLGYASFAVPYSLPDPSFSYERVLDNTKRIFGYELIGYWQFFCSDDAEKIIFDHLDSFLALVYPADPTHWRTKLAPPGALEQTLLTGYTSPLPPYFTEQDKSTISATFKRNGLKAPLCSYKVLVEGHAAEDDKQIPQTRYLPPPSSPIFFGAALKDVVAVPALGQGLKGPAFKNHNVTIKDYDADHWLILSVHEEICRDLEAWFKVVLETNAEEVASSASL